ncbi:MAG: NADH-quinone oxidoreductase subunit D [Candidatus Hatepunaea meridiana]|nr:NADH-quinone oxidoreductase subunit D [Candidatus Hatepunaea meridiana]
MKNSLEHREIMLPASAPMTLAMGPSHPAMHGIIRLNLQLDGERIVDSTIDIGFLHRGFEKMVERHTWNQAIIYTDRLNYVSAIINNTGYCLAVEKLLGIETPPRCQTLRVIMSELSRVMDHLTCLGAQVMETGAMTAFLYAMQAREWIYELVEMCCGARVTTNWTRIGGLSADVPPEFVDAVKERIPKLRRMNDEFSKLLTKNRIFIDRTKGVGVMSKEDAVSWGFTGPILRASGVPFDVRRDTPYLNYDEFDFEIPVGSNGDVYDRYNVRLFEMEQSLRITEQALEKLPDGPVNIADKTISLPDKLDVYGNIEGLINQFKLIMDDHGIKVPPGETYLPVEAANGELGFYIVSTGEDVPYKCRCRPPCLPITMAMPTMIKGEMIADIIPIFGSVNMIGGELDR